MSPLNKETFLIWFNTSNKYLFLNTALKTLIDLYFNSDNERAFLDTANSQLGLPEEVAKNYFNEITVLLNECNAKEKVDKTPERPYLENQEHLLKKYKIDNYYIHVAYPSQDILNFLHNQINHLSISDFDIVQDLDIDIQADDDYFYLYVNKLFVDSYLKTNYHLLQGKFNLLLLNLIYQTTEDDWLAMLHGSSVSNGKQALIFVGHSGNGKSTFTSLLVANGYDLVTDDITPIHATNGKVCSTPSGISIKEGSFEILNKYISNFGSSKEFVYSTKKGKSKYITPSSTYKKTMLPCENIILVKYDKDSSTNLVKIPPKEILEVIIPDSWTSPLEKNVETLMKWLKNLNYFELSYSDSTEAIKKISTLFK